ncbi:MAG: PrgI family protein [Clostridia bacterium]|nr:PrgI family protein [Clostridia bacterium]
MANQKINNNIDLTQVKHKLVAGFSKRQLIFIGSGLIIGFIEFMVCKKLSYQFAAFMLAITLSPIFIICEKKVQNMYFEKFMWHFFRFHLLSQNRRKERFCNNEKSKNSRSKVQKKKSNTSKE